MGGYATRQASHHPRRAPSEQYVQQQLMTKKKINTYYWSNERGGAEIDFIVETGGEMIPIEVKAEVNLKAKSLKIFRDKFNPSRSIRLSMADYKQEEWLLNLPLYALSLYDF